MMRPGKPCRVHGCPNLQPCTVPEHAPVPWQEKAGYTRSELSGSAQQRRARRIIKRDGGRCHVCGLLGADQADHVVARTEGGSDTDANMAAIHECPCHVLKTMAESARARASGT